MEDRSRCLRLYCKAGALVFFVFRSLFCLMMALCTLVFSVFRSLFCLMMALCTLVFSLFRSLFCLMMALCTLVFSVFRSLFCLMMALCTLVFSVFRSLFCLMMALCTVVRVTSMNVQNSSEKCAVDTICKIWISMHTVCILLIDISNPSSLILFNVKYLWVTNNVSSYTL